MSEILTQISLKASPPQSSTTYQKRTALSNFHISRFLPRNSWSAKIIGPAPNPIFAYVLEIVFFLFALKINENSDSLILCRFAIHYAPNNLSYVFQMSFISSI